MILVGPAWSICISKLIGALLFNKHGIRIKANDAILVNRRNAGFIGIYHYNVPRYFEMCVASSEVLNDLGIL